MCYTDLGAEIDTIHSFLQGRELAGALTSVTWFISQNRLPRRHWDHFTVGKLESADVAGTPRS